MATYKVSSENEWVDYGELYTVWLSYESTEETKLLYIVILRDNQIFAIYIKCEAVRISFPRIWPLGHTFIRRESVIWMKGVETNMRWHEEAGH